MNDHLRRGIIFFNEGQYFNAHESWEDLWRESEGDSRTYFQGLVQVAVGLHHLKSGNLRGGNRVLIRGLSKLEIRPDQCHGIENAALVAELQKVVGSPDSPLSPIRIVVTVTGPAGERA